MIDDIMTALSKLKINSDKEAEICWVVYDAKNKSKALECLKELRNKGKAAAGILYDESKTKDEYKDYAKKNHISNIKFFI